MRILLTHNNYEITGGADLFYRDVGRVLGANGHNVAWFSGASEGISDTEWARYFPQVVDYNHGSLVRRIAAFPAMVYSKTARRSFERLLDDFQPDIVHAFAIYVKLTPSILDAARARNIPVVMTCNDYKLLCPNYTLYHHGAVCEQCKGERFYKAAINRCNRDSLAFSVGVALEAYAHSRLGVYRRNVHTYLFESEFIANKTREFWGDSFRWRLMRKPFNSAAVPLHAQADDYFAYVGRLHESKGVHILLEAMRQCPQARLMIVGDGPQRESLEGRAAELGLHNIEFCGWKTVDEVQALIARSRFTVVPSVWYENFPYVITQTFASGKACIGSRMGGIPELIKHERFGLLYPAFDAGELASAIRRLWDNPEATARMGREAKQWADANFNDDAVHRTLAAIYEEVLEDYRVAARTA